MSSTSEKLRNQYAPKRNKPGLEGNLYEVKLLTLFVCRGINLDYEFEIGTEIKEGVKFDDIVFKYLDKSSNKKFSIIVQAKHKSNANSKIEINNLLVDHFDDFGLCKYYFSYQKAKRDPLFQDYQIKHALIITNRKFAEMNKIPHKNEQWKILQNIKNIIRKILLDHGNRELGLAHDEENGKLYHFEKHILPALKNALIEYIFKMIATELVDSLMSKSDRTEDFIEKYYQALVNEVIDPKSKQFRSDFIYEQENNSAELIQFRIILKSWMKKKGLNLDTILIDREKRFNFMINIELHKDQETFAKIVVNDDDIKEFLKVFIIATEEPSEKELDKLIENELKKQFSNDQIAKILHVIIENWTKGSIKISNAPKDARFITSENIKQLLTEEDRKINEKLFQGHLSGLSGLSHINFDINNNAMIKNLDKFFNSNMKVLNISSKCITLTSVKIYKHKSQCIVTQLSLLNYSTLNNLLNAFLNKFCDHRLLLIECDVDKINHPVKDQLINVLSSYINKKVIFVGSEKNKFLSEFKTKFLSLNQFCGCSDEDFELDQLTKDSQIKFLEECSIHFQGCSVKLNEIPNDNIKLAINGNDFMEFLKGKEFEIGEFNKEIENIQEYYISRKFVTKINIDEKSTVFIIDDDDNIFSSKRIYTRIENSLQYPISKSENSLIEQQQKNMLNSKICVLRKEGGKLYLLHNGLDLSLESKTIEKINKTYSRNISLLSSNPGMGKSYVFNYLCHQTKIKNPTLWVSKIDLNSSSKVLKEILENKNVNASDNLMKFLNATLFKRSIEKIYFQNFLTEGKVVLFFDAFDEISPSYKSVTIKLIEILNGYSNMNRIFISSRPHDQILHSINETFQVSSYELIPFSEADQIEFLQKFWQFNLRDKDFDNGKFISFTNKLISLFKDSLKNSNIDFLETPLHTMMIGATFKNEFETFIDLETEIGDKSFSEKLYKSLNLSYLYKNFIYIKCYEVYYGEKNKIDVTTEISQNMMKSFHKEQIRKYQILSLKHLFGNHNIHSILKDGEQDILNSLYTEIDRIGIMILKNDNHHFIHQTYAEYFAALYIVNNMNRESVVNFFVTEVLEEQNKMVCSFVNEILYNDDNDKYYIPEMKSVIENKLGEKFHLAIHNSWQEIVRYLLNNNVDLTYINDKNENVFHFACEISNQLILSMILEKIKNNLEKFKIFLQMKNDHLKQTPLLLIARNGTLESMKKMIDIFDIEISETEANHVDKDNSNILHYSLMNRDVNVLQFVIMNLKKRPKIFESLIQSNDKLGLSPLLYASAYGSVENIRFLFDALRDINCAEDVIKSADNYNDNILHLAIENRNIEVFPFVIDQLKCRPEIFEMLIQRKGLKGRSALLHVARYGSVKNVSYLFEMLNNLNCLETALKSIDNHHDNIIHLAAENKNVEVLSFIVEQLKCQPEIFESLIQNKNLSSVGCSPLLYVVRHSSVLNVRFLFDTLRDLGCLEAAIKSVDENNDNILHFATCNKDMEVLPFIIDQLKYRPELLEWLIQSNGFEGQSPLLRASFKSSIENVRFLFDTLRELNLLDDAIKFVDNDNDSILNLTAQNKNVEVLPFIVDQFKNQPEIFKSLIQSKGWCGLSPLLRAARFGNIANIKFLFNVLREFNLFENAVLECNIFDENILKLAALNSDSYVLQFINKELENYPELLNSL